MGKQIKRSLIMLLCIAMIAATCGIAAFAEDTAAVAELIPTGETTGTKYTSIDDAFAAASYGGYTIKLLDDATTEQTCTFYFGSGDVVIDLNDHNINFTYAGEKVQAAILELKSNNELKITGRGTITAEGRALEVNMENGIFVPKLTIDKDVTIISKTEVAVLLYAIDYNVNIYGTVKSFADDSGAIMGNGKFTDKWGTLTIHDGATVSAVTTAIYHPQGGTLNVEGGTITSEGSTAIEVRRGTLNVSGTPVITSNATEFTSKANENGATSNGAAVAVAPYDSKAINVKINGGTFTAKKALSYENPNNVENPSVNISVTGGTFSTDITEELKKVTSNVNDIIIADNGDGTYSVGTPVAQVGEVKYTSLEAAFAAAETGATVTLLADATVNARIDVSKDVTLNLNGHKIGNDNCGIFQISGGSLNITGEGTIETTGYNLPFRVTSNITNSDEKIDSVLTVGKDVSVISNDYCGILYVGNGAVVNVYGKVEVLGGYAAIQGNGQYSVKDNNNWGRTVLNIFPGAEISAKGTAVYHPQFGGVVNISGGKITSETGCAIEMRAGELNVTGDAVIETKATKFEYAYNNDGATTKGAAVAAALYQDRIISINISGGTYKGAKALSYENPNNVTNPSVNFNITGGTFSTDITEALTNADVTSNIAKITVAANDDGTFGVKERNENFEKVAVIQRTTGNKLTFLAGINYLDYEKAGFRVTVNGTTKEISANTVYTKMEKADGTEVNSEEFGTPYFFAADFDVTDKEVSEFKVMPFAKLLNGNDVEAGTATTVTVGGAE